MSITITTTITVRPPNVVPIFPTSTSTQLLVHPHGGVFPRIIHLEHWKNYLGLKCAIIHYLLWGTQLRQTWVTRVSQSHSSQKKKNSAGLRQIFEWGGLLLRSIPILISGIRPTESIACGNCQGHFVESFLDTFQFECPFSWGFTNHFTDSLHIQNWCFTIFIGVAPPPTDTFGRPKKSTGVNGAADRPIIDQRQRRSSDCVLHHPSASG